MPTRTLSPQGGLALSGVPTRILAPKKRIVRSQINWREEQVPARMLGLEEECIVRSTSIGEGNEAFLTRVHISLPSRHVLKTLRESPKEKI